MTDVVFDDFDPTKQGAVEMPIPHASVGKTPAGFAKIHAELLPGDLMKLVGYDPRSIEAPPRRGKDPQNISPEIIELRRTVQRTVDQPKVDEMVEYLANAIRQGKFADWSEIDVVTVSKPNMSRYRSEFIIGFPNSADYLITDGQHRYCAILDFVRKYPDLANSFTQAVAISVLPHDKLAEWGGQSFHDKNYFHTQVKVTKALAVDSRDLHNKLAKELRELKVIKDGGGVNEVKDSLSASASEFSTHAMLYKLVRGFTEGRRGLFKGGVDNQNLTDSTFETYKAQLTEYINLLNGAFPNWTVVPGREDYLFRSSSALQAFGVLGHLIYTKVVGKDGTETARLHKQMVAAIGEKNLDWRRTNVKDWGNVIGTVKSSKKVLDDGTEVTEEAVSPASTRQAIDGAIRFLKDRSGLTAHLAAVGTTGEPSADGEPE